MLSRLKNAAWTFIVVTGLFLVYHGLVVPWIEPSAGRHRSLLAHLIGAASGSQHRLRAARLESLFSAGDWELDSPIVLETDRGLLLVGDYLDREDGTLELKPFTMILFGSLRENGRPEPADCLVLRSPGGAVVRFDQPLRLARGEFGRVVGGWLVGPVTISSPESRPGANDRLDIRTGSIQITPERITAPQELSFRYGPNQGRGRDLIITLESLTGLAGSAPTMGINQLRSFELVHLDHLELHLNEPAGKPFGSRAVAEDREPSAGAADATVLEVRCRGPFRLDMLRQVASFEDQVVVSRRGKPGQDDRLSGDMLRLYWGETPAADVPPDTDSSLALPAWHLERIAVRGRPAVLELPSETLTAHAAQVEYDFLRGDVRVADPQGAQLRYQGNEFASPALEYRPAEQGGLGRLVARGPGHMRGSLPERPDQVLEAHWQDRLILQPHGGDQAISLISGARVQYAGMGEFAAEQLHLWLQEIPADERAESAERRRPAYRPVRMLAKDHVTMESPQLNATVEKVELWIRYDGEEPVDTLAAEPAPRPESPAEDASIPDRSPPLTQYELAGQHLQVQLLQRGSDSLVEHVILEGDVRLHELQTSDPDVDPIRVRADLVQVEHANGPQARLRLVGRPVELAGRGLVLQGNNVQVNREHNLAWILGPGRLSLPPDAALQDARHASRDDAPGNDRPPMTVTWTERLAFDGQSARFRGDVRLQATHMLQPAEQSVLRVHGGALDVQFQPGIDLRETQPGRSVQLQSLLFPGSVFLEHTSYASGGAQAIDRLQVRELSLDQPSGRLHALGPGWGTSTRPGASFSETAVLGRLGAATERERFHYLRVDFEDEIAGNYRHRDLGFRGRVRALYGPVRHLGQELDPDPPGGLDNGVFLLSSQQLGVAETPSAGSDPSAIEVVADGNAMVEGRAFTARGWRISYAHAKQLLILEGDGRNDAELWRKGSVTPDAAAQQIRFWTHNHSLQVDGGRFLDLSTFGARTAP